MSSFSLKDHLFNEKTINQLASYFFEIDSRFPKKKFVNEVVSGFDGRELKERIVWITDVLESYLPKEYPRAVSCILKALPEELDPSLSDNDFGDFIIAPLSHYIATRGCQKKYLDLSLSALKEITKRFSAEDAMRYFINTFPEETLLTLEQWAHDNNYHVRRLVSEATRPKLPWSQKIGYTEEDTLPLLSQLYSDPTRYVTRSVANHLNDVSKTNPELVLETLTQWKKDNNQEEKEMEYITKHALRTLLKQGNPNALCMLGYQAFSGEGEVNISLVKNKIKLNEYLEFDLVLNLSNPQRLLINYAIHFLNGRGGFSKKVFLLKNIQHPKQKEVLSKKHSFKTMTTRTLYSGIHHIEIQVNGVTCCTEEFTLDF